MSSPVIRKPSLASVPRRRRTTLTAPLPPLVLALVRALVVLVVLWSEHLSFRFAASYTCGFDDTPSTKGRVWDGTLALGTGSSGAPSTSTSGGWTVDSRWRDALARGDRRGAPFHVLVVADPQLLDMKSYSGRNWALRWLGVRISDAYARKAWTVVTRLSRGKGGTGVDAVVWLGDLLDSGVDTVDQRECVRFPATGSLSPLVLADAPPSLPLSWSPCRYASLVHRFHLLFPLPRASTSSFSTLSSRAASSSSLVPPIPSIIVPGNHDLGLHRSSTSLAAYGRERFREAFGPTWGLREWNGWEVAWIDSMALLEDEFWDTDGGGQYGDMKRWLEELGRGAFLLLYLAGPPLLGRPRFRVVGRLTDSHSPTGPVTAPRILLTHIPLYRPEGTSCGRSREHSRPIHQGAGRNYQNEVDSRASQYLLRTVRPSLIYSGDDHDYCVVRHEGVSSPLDGVTPVTETTVKAFSMAMGVRRPGYHLLSLYGPLPPAGTASASAALAQADADELELEDDPPVSFTYTQSNCLLPDAIATYLHVYLPLALSVLAFFLVPKLALVVRSALSRRRHARRSAVARANGSTPRSGGGANGAGGGAGHRHKRSLSATLLGVGAGRGRRAGAGAAAEEDADAEDVEAQFPGLLGGTAHLDAVGFGLLGGGAAGGPSDDEDELELLEEEEKREAAARGGAGAGLPLAHERGAARRSPGGHVRRVSRVWLWEGGADGRGSSPQGSISLSSSSSHRLGTGSPNSLSARLARVPARLVERLASNTPLRAALRPAYRALRSAWRKGAAPFVRMSGGQGWAGRGGQALAEAVSETGEVAWPAVVCWLGVAVWYAL